MTRFLKQLILVALFGLPLAVLTAFGVVVLWPLFMLLDWIDNEKIKPSSTLREVTEPWRDYVQRIRTVM